MLWKFSKKKNYSFWPGFRSMWANVIEKLPEHGPEKKILKNSDGYSPVSVSC